MNRNGKMLLARVADPFFVLSAYISKRLSALQAEAQLSRFESVGYGCRIEGAGTFLFSHRISLGAHVSLGRECYFQALGTISIGSYTHISRNVTIYSANHNMAGNLLPYDDTFVEKPVTIGDFVWIGMHVNIVPGVTIGDGAVIGLGTTVSQNVPPGAVVVGPAQRIVRSRDPETVARMIREDQFLTH